MATCPKCTAVITRVTATPLDAHLPDQAVLRSVAFSCPACGVVLGVTVDPLAIKMDTITDIAELLRKRSV
jgi:hypothetical protein